MTNYDDLCPITIKEKSDGSFDLEWDELDPRCFEINDWTAEDFEEAIATGLQEVLLEKRDDR
jgi:hypothetical protein